MKKEVREYIKHICGNNYCVLQQILNSMDCEFKIPITGKFDKETRDALTYFQKEYGYKLNKPIPITGKLDNPTFDLLEMYLENKMAQQ